MTLPKLKPKVPEIFLGMGNEEYRRDTSLSQSDLAWMRKSPRHFKRRAELNVETDAMKFGTVFHMAILEPARFKELYILEPEAVVLDGIRAELNKKIKRHREWLSAWKIDNAHRVILTDRDLDSLVRMIRSVQEDQELVDLITTGDTEVVALWDYRGRKCKGKADLFNTKTPHGRVVIDFKKTQDASESGFTRAVNKYSLDLQAAFYQEGFQIDKFFWVAVEEKTGAIGKWDASLYLDRGKALMDRLMARLDECEQKNQWPWYSNSFEILRPPTWLAAIDSEEDQF